MKLQQLADAIGGKLVGDGRVELRGVASLEAAGPADLAFVRSPAWLARLRESRAGAVILPADVDSAGRPAILSANPGLDFARAARLLAPEPALAAGVHTSAVVDAAASIDPTASIGPLCYVGPACRIGPRTRLEAGVVLEREVEIGADCRVRARCALRHARLGDRVVLEPGVVIGADGFGYALDDRARWSKAPQRGGVVIGDDVEIGAGTTVDRGSLGDTRIGAGSKIDNLVQVAHNCEIGEDVLIVAQVGLAGSTRVERGAILMAQAGVADHRRIGERAFVGPQAGVMADVPAGERIYGSPGRPLRENHRIVGALGRLPDLFRRVRALERRAGLRGEAKSRDREETGET
jgi:UDP-3-O-[3-hydroxymyristoyl] glucosamine N-acyltransferase